MSQLLKKPLLAPLLLLLLVPTHCLYELHLHPVESGARCLDGTPAGVYISPGDETSKIMLFFEGGGLCGGSSLSETLEDCYQRAGTKLGSSSSYEKIQNLDEYGILSQKSEVNSLTYNWTKVFIPYCDGSLHQGTRNRSISYKDRNLYFRGTNNTLQHFKYLNETIGLFSADLIVVTGVSAGGQATFQWSNYIFEQSEKKNVISIPDSGIFINQFIDPFTNKTPMIDSGIALRKLVNTEIQIPLAECGKDYPGLAECFSAGVIVKYLKNPFFIIQSQYDHYAINAGAGVHCLTDHYPSQMTKCNESEVASIESYRKATLQAFKNYTDARTDIGIWAPSCIQHGFEIYDSYDSDRYKIPSDSGITLIDAIKQFIDNPVSEGNLWIDEVGWPDNKGCSGIDSRRRYYGLTVQSR